MAHPRRRRGRHRARHRALACSAAIGAVTLLASAATAWAQPAVRADEATSLTIKGHGYLGWVLDLEGDAAAGEFPNQFFINEVALSLHAVFDARFEAALTIAFEDASGIFGTGATGLFVQEAYLKINDPLDLPDATQELILGQQRNLYVGPSQDIFGFRFAMLGAAERYGIAHEFDAGISYGVALADAGLRVTAGVFNNNPQGTLLDGDFSTVSDLIKAPALQAWWHHDDIGIGVLGAWIFHSGVGPMFEDRGSRFFGQFYYVQPTVAGDEAANVDAGGGDGAAPSGGNVRAGLEVIWALDRNAAPAGSAWVFSVYGAIGLGLFSERFREFGVLLRVDLVEPNNASASGADLALTGIVGAYYAPIEAIRLMVGYRKHFNLDTEQNGEDVVGLWAMFRY